MNSKKIFMKGVRAIINLDSKSFLTISSEEAIFDNESLETQFSKNVVLDFPFKDCVLEGGQSSEEEEDIYFQLEEDLQDFQVREFEDVPSDAVNVEVNESLFNQQISYDF